jgi:hypothetical protein
MRRNGTTTQPVRPTTTGRGDTERAVARFPLVQQRRFRCTDLETRVRTVRECARSCHEPANSHDRINLACTAWNLAALIAADCGVPGLAVDLCRRQFQMFQAAWPLSGKTAIASLQPLVNLTRLTRRAGSPDGAYRELDQIERAFRAGGDALIHGERISFRGFTTADSEQSSVAKWMRTVMCDDGTRCLVTAGRWEKAAAHAARYDDAQEKLRESRQTRIIAHVLGGHTDSALTLIDSSVVSEPWEPAVAACLRAYANINAARRNIVDLDAMLGAVRSARLSCDRPTTLFHIRLGLTAVDIASGEVDDEVDLLCAEQSADAFARPGTTGQPRLPVADDPDPDRRVGGARRASRPGRRNDPRIDPGRPAGIRSGRHDRAGSGPRRVRRTGMQVGRSVCQRDPTIHRSRRSLHVTGLREGDSIQDKLGIAAASRTRGHHIAATRRLSRCRGPPASASLDQLALSPRRPNDSL